MCEQRNPGVNGYTQGSGEIGEEGNGQTVNKQIVDDYLSRPGP
jgi:hypothetical protein